MSTRLKAVVALLQRGEQATAADLDAVFAAGVDDAALDDALEVAFCFEVINRLADALAFNQETDAGVAASAKALLKFGYR